MAKESSHPSRRRLRWLITALLLSCLMLAFVYDPIAVVSDVASTARVRWELPQARERWEREGPVSYSIHVKGAVPMVCFVDGELTVRDGSLVQVRMRVNPLVPESPMLLVGQEDWGRPGCSYQDLTVEQMFERVDSGLRGAGLLGAPLTVHFDEERGFITEYRFGRASQGGLFGHTVSECCTWFEFDALDVGSP